MTQWNELDQVANGPRIDSGMAMHMVCKDGKKSTFSHKVNLIS